MLASSGGHGVILCALQPPNWQLYQLDQTSDDSVKQLIDRVAIEHGRIDVLYLNAGEHLLCRNLEFCSATHSTISK